jgi:cytochrome c oxidase subunit 2
MIEYFVESASTYAPRIDFLFDLITLIVGAWFVLVLAVMVYLMVRFRRREGVKAAYITGELHSEKKWTHYPHYTVIAMDVVIIVFTVMVWVDVKQTLPEAEDKIRVVGQQWSWIFQHSGPDGKLDTEDDISTVNDLHVKKDTVYHFVLESRDVLHNFSVPAFRLRQDTIPGRTVTGWFEPTKAGSYDIECAEMCGYGHGIMGATIVVHENDESYNATMEAIQNRTYESDYQKRLNQMSVEAVSSNEEPFTNKLLSSFN